LDRGPCSLWSRLKGRGSRCIAKHSRTSVEAKRSGLGWAWPGPAMCVVAVVVRLGLVRLGLAVWVRYGAARYGPVGNGEAVKAWSVVVGYGAARRVRAVRVRRGTARRGMVRRSGLGWDSPVFVSRGGLGEVCCVRATLGLSGRSSLGLVGSVWARRSWLCVARRGGAGRSR
jgi:hypothetical protein